MLISKLGVNSDDILVLSAEQVEWPSTALGCPEPGVGYAAVIVSGWKFILAHGDQTYTYHSDESGSNVVECTEPPMEIEVGDTVNVVEAAGLGDTVVIFISRIDPTSGEYAQISEVTDPGEIAKFISILDAASPDCSRNGVSAHFPDDVRDAGALGNLPVHLPRH